MPDTACRKTLVGQQVLEGIETERRNLKSTRKREGNQFRSGKNGSVETDQSRVVGADHQDQAHSN